MCCPRTANVEMLGYQPNDVLKQYMQQAKAFIFAAEEDFGITPVEAQACGTPVLAYGRGGSLETVIDGETGSFFAEQTAEAIADLVNEWESTAANFDPDRIRAARQRIFAIAVSPRIRRIGATSLDGLE